MACRFIVQLVYGTSGCVSCVKKAVFYHQSPVHCILDHLHFCVSLLFEHAFSSGAFCAFSPSSSSRWCRCSSCWRLLLRRVSLSCVQLAASFGPIESHGSWKEAGNKKERERENQVKVKYREKEESSECMKRAG